MAGAQGESGPLPEVIHSFLASVLDRAFFRRGALMRQGDDDRRLERTDDV
jgi:hypothetical protein